MKRKLRVVLYLVSVLIVLLTFNVALGLVDNPSIVEDTVESNDGKVGSFEVMAFERTGSEGNFNSKLNSTTINLPIIKSETSLGIQEFILPSTSLDVRGIIDGFAPTPIPPSILLLGTALIGFICVARRSFFTK
ncbi:hypothetical protein ACTRXD_13365 [Nitrospira sp. T9]|uniref:hypothetical protein n=1 Tax=unclassified Nitrospira TaxID=2652172 RepID=UPI003F9A5FB2